MGVNYRTKIDIQRSYTPKREPVFKLRTCLRCQQEKEIEVPMRICERCTKLNKYNKFGKVAATETGMIRHHGESVR